MAESIVALWGNALAETEGYCAFQELEELLANVPCSYDDFVKFILAGLEDHVELIKKMIKFIKDNLEVKSDAVITFAEDELGIRGLLEVGPLEDGD